MTDERQTLKARYEAMVKTAKGLLDAAEHPDSARAKRIIRDYLQAEYGASRRAAHRAVAAAATLRAGGTLPQWGGQRPDAGRPRKAIESSGSEPPLQPQE